MKGPIVLVGPPGAGKSTAGARAAARLGMPFVDLDTRIAAPEGGAAALFRDEGEAAFRVRELEALTEVLDGSDVLVAAGSGVVDTAPGRRLLEERALCVALDVTADVALPRMEQQDAGRARRPWLPSEPAAARGAWEARVQRRRASWDALAAARVDACGGLDDVASALVRSVDALRPIVPRVPDAVEAETVEGALALARGDQAARAALVVVDSAVAASVVAARVADTCAVYVVVPGGEGAKALHVVEDLARRLVAAGARRGTRIVAVGGGAVLDAVGLCAALLFRGTPWVAVPTTLLAQADAGIGGKTAVDLDGRKNILGAFHPPLVTVVCPAFLSSLKPLDHQAGRAEMLKHELLAADAPADGSALVHSREVMRSLAVKTAVVRRDPFERGLRAALNLGHTIGHALETTFGLGHGQAVQHGLRAMLRLSMEHAALHPRVAQTLDARVRALGPLAPLPGLEGRLHEVLGHMAVDKKGDDLGPRFVLLRAPGSPILARVPERAVRAAVRALGDEGPPA